jgi:IclR family transcriptional regulator, KDG regulon repressor
MSKPEPAQPKGFVVQSVQRALGILELLADCRAEMTLTDISTQLELHPSTVHRLLGALVQSGFVQQDHATRKYLLGLNTLKLAAATRSATSVTRTAHPYLLELAHRIGETTNLLALDGEGVVVLDRIEPANPLRYTIEIGARVPIHASSSGKLLLAYLDERAVDRMLKGRELPALTNNTITNYTQLCSELGKIKQSGIAYDFEERDVGVRCVSIPVRDYTGEVIAAISVAGPSSRMTKPRLQRLSFELKEVGQDISAALGYDDPTPPPAVPAPVPMPRIKAPAKSKTPK